MGGTTFSSSSGRCTRVFNVFNTFFIILALGAFVAMALILNEYNKKLQEHMDAEVEPITESKCDQTVDIAVVGAGAAGAYAAWKLSTQFPEKSIHLYEGNGRIGGRLYSLPVPGIGDFVADLGAMRFYREWHELTFKAIDELGLEVINFTTPTENEKIYHLRGEYLLREHLDAGEVPYGLSEAERNVSGRTDKILALWNSQFIQPGEDDQYERRTTDGKMVYNLGNYNEWQKHGTSEALKYIADISGFDDWVYANQNMAHVSDTEYVENPEPWPPYLTLKRGADALPKVMVERFLNANARGNQLFLHHELLAIDSSTLNISLTFKHTQTEQLSSVCTEKLVLATGATALDHVTWPERNQNAEVKRSFETTIDIPAVKVFLAYDSPWWRKGGIGWAFDDVRAQGDSLKMVVTDLPVRMVLDIGEDSQSGKSLLLVYNDYENNLNFWKHHLENGERDSTALDCEFPASVELVNLTQTYLAKIFNLSTEDIPRPYATIAHAWYDKPYYGGWHMWSPGSQFHEIQDSVLKPVSDREIYVIGEAYSESVLQGWIEGAYERAEAMLQTYFNTNNFKAKTERRKSFSHSQTREPFQFLRMRH